MADTSVTPERFLFVGEKPSVLAHTRRVTWADGRLAAKQLFDALDAAGIERAACTFVNLFGDSPDAIDRGVTPTARRRAGKLRRMAAEHRIVALGRRVAAALRELNVTHTEMVHPAARGLIRRKDAYAEHVRTALGRTKENTDG